MLFDKLCGPFLTVDPQREEIQGEHGAYDGGDSPQAGGKQHRVEPQGCRISQQE
jgi:hypothetical protein